MRGWRRLRGQTVVFHLRTGRSIQGLVWEARGGGLLVLRDALLLERANGRVTQHALDGETLVETGQVEFAQRVIAVQVVN